MRKSLGRARKHHGDHWWYGNCLYDDSKFTGYLLKHMGGNWWLLMLPDGRETPAGTREECMQVAVDLARGVRPSSNRVHPGE
jgi:hypothetical protein